jgi:hypothetical protein
MLARLSAVVVGVAVLGIVVTCQELPSQRPLGTGPLASHRQMVVRPARIASERADASQAASDAASVSIAKNADAGRSTDAGSDGAAKVVQTQASDAAPAALFAGEYRGKDHQTIRVAGMPDESVDDPNARLTVEKRTNGTLGFTPYYSDTGKPVCTLSGKANANVASIDAGQSCFAMGPMKTTVKSGSARIEGDRLTLEVNMELEVTLPDATRRGSLEYRFEGRRK